MFLLFFKSLFEAMNDDSKAVLAAAEMVERAINAPVVAFQMLKLLHLYLRVFSETTSYILPLEIMFRVQQSQVMFCLVMIVSPTIETIRTKPKIPQPNFPLYT